LIEIEALLSLKVYPEYAVNDFDRRFSRQKPQGVVIDGDLSSKKIVESSRYRPANWHKIINFGNLA
jgi:hypothetical protein